MIRNYYYTEEYSSRAIIRRCFLAKGRVTAEKFMILVEVLKKNALSMKKSFRDLAGARIDFDGYQFADGFMLRACLTQSECSGLSFLFKNPYQEALKVFSSLFSSPLSLDELTLSISKERVLDAQYDLSKLPYDSSLSMLGVSYSKPIVNLHLLESTTLDDVKEAYEEVRKNKVGEYLYVGKRQKSDPLRDLADFEKDFGGLPLDFSFGEDDRYEEDFLYDNVSYVVQFDRIDDVIGYDTTTLVLSGICHYLKEKLSQDFKVKAIVRHDIISKIRGVISVSLPQGKWQMVSRFLSSFFSPSFLQESMKLLPSTIEQMKMDSILVFMNFNSTLKRMERLNDLSLPLDSGIVSDRSLDLKKARELGLSMTMVHEHKCIHDKGVIFHD